MKHSLLTFCLFLFVFSCKQDQLERMPIPTDGDTIVKEDMENPEKSNAKKEWKKQLFATPDGMDAEYIEYQNSYRKFQKRNTAIQSRTPVESIADGLIEGEWIEKGSNNQSGSVFVTEYEQETKDLYLVSAGGQLWKGGLDGQSWEVVNQKARFHDQFLDIVILEDGSKRILAAISNKPHYSDDMGLTWTASAGFEPLQYARIKNSFTADDSLSYTYFLGQKNSDQNLGLFVTKDKGLNYTIIHSFGTSDRRNLSLSITKNSNEIYVLEQLSSSSSRLHKMNEDQSDLVVVQASMNVSYNQGEGSFVSVEKDGTTYMYVLERAGSSNVHKSIDFGATWEKKDDLPSNPWGVGLFVSAENPDFLMYGDIECYRSFDGGSTFTKLNGWGDYYSDVTYSIHADMMYFSDYKDQDTDEYFMLISNHGGVSKLDDYDGLPLNISLKGLNVSQYYSVRTSPDGKFVYAGAQDQGFQRAAEVDGQMLNFTQLISGDYGHIVFTEDKHLWTVYPGGWVSYWPDPQNQGIVSEYTIDSEDESVWIPPLYATEGLGIDQIFAAGGSIDGGPGSYLIRLFAGGNVVQESQLDYNFKANSGGTVSAIATGDKWEESIYVATNNGRFFYSHDSGDTFTKSVNVNGGHYLYGQVIIPSKLKPNKIYTGGNGYNGVPVMRSIDGGVSFEPFGDGLPNTTVLGMTMNEEESLLFAATTSGPYVCILSQQKWYDMSGEAAPDVTYWSVELVNDDNTVRFGTYGRGIFDFNISLYVDSKEIANENQSKANIYPNPVTDNFTIEWPAGSISDAAIFNISGQMVKTINTNNKKSYESLLKEPAGQYFLRFNHDGSIKSQQIIKL